MESEVVRDASVKCKQCLHVFRPDLKTSGHWTCPGCGANNPNLRRHYRSVADLLILGLIVTMAVVLLGSTERLELTAGVLVSIAWSALLLFAIIKIYSTRSPWRNMVVKTLIWVVFGARFALYGLEVIAAQRPMPWIIGPLVVFVVVFSYLFWLAFATRRALAEPWSDQERT
jgi:hypothetical protein